MEGHVKETVVEAVSEEDQLVVELELLVEELAEEERSEQDSDRQKIQLGCSWVWEKGNSF